MSDDGEDLSDVETVLKNYGIALRSAEGDFRNFGNILDDVHSKWEQFGAIDKRAVAQAFAGTRQQENFLVLMENYGKALEYAGVSADSAGIALEKFGSYEDSLEAKTARFTAALEGLTLDTVDAGFIGDLIDAGTSIVKLTEEAGLLKAALVGLGAGAVLKSISAVSDSFLTAKQNITSLGAAMQTMRSIQDTNALSGDAITRLGTLTKSLTDQQLRLVLSTQQLSAAQMTQILVAGGVSEAEAAAKLQTIGLVAAEGTATTATVGFSGAVLGLGTALKAAFSANPVGMIMLTAGAAYELVRGILAVHDALTITAEEAEAAMEQSLSEFEEASNRVKSLNDELQTTQDRIAELSTKGTLSFVEETELQKLRESVELLQIQADLAEKERIIHAKEATENTVVAYQKNFKNEISSDAVAEYLRTSNATGNNAILFSDESNISAMLAGVEQMKRLRDELDKDSEHYAKDYQHYQEIIDQTTDSIWEQADVLRTYKSSLEAIPYDDLTDEQRAALDGINAAIALIYQTLDPKKWTEIQWNSIVDDKQYADDVKKLQELASAAEITADTIKNQFPALAKACEDAGLKIEDVVDNLNASFERTDSNGLSTYTAQLSSLSDVISGLRSSYDVLKTAQDEMASGGGLSPDTIEKLASAEENYLDYLYEENGVIKLNTEAWKENADAKMLGEIDEIQKEIDSLEEQNNVLRENIAYFKEQRSKGLDGVGWDAQIEALSEKIRENTAVIEENQGKMAIYSSLYGSITGNMDSYAAALQNFSNVSSTIDSVTSSFQTLANLQAEVANGFAMSLDKALEFAKVYPEILNNAQMSADGQIMLNESVVNSFIDGKKAELDALIDAEVAKLNADKEVLQAKMSAAQAQLDLAKAIAEGESGITKELAEYRINAGNIVAQALIDAGVDEATAFKLAAEAMSQNAEEFNRVAADVCTDVNGNFNGAAYDLAQTMYQNLSNVKRNLADVAAQAHETATAIAGVSSGAVQGSTQVVGNAGGGVAGKGAKINILSGKFKGTSFSYTAKESGLEDFISQIELDISNYQDAISQIDGQIAALQVLKNTPLKSFGSDTGSGSGGSGSSQKEVEEYIASIDQYRDAVERLRKTQEEAGRLENDIDNATSYEKKIALQKELVAAYREEQDALHSLNDARDATIAQGVASLKELGFAVEYNADTNDLWISNMDRLNELTADSAGEYDTLQEATNALRKGTEDLIKTMTELNDSNREGSETWRELDKSIVETTVSMYENAVQAKKNAAMLAENWMESAIESRDLDDVKRYSSEIIAEYRAMQDIIQSEADYLRSRNYSDTSDEVSKLIDLWQDYADSIKKVKQQVVDCLIDIVDAAHDSVDEIQNVSDVLHDAADEFAANDGFITVDTYQALLKLGPQYMQMLRDENGLWQINEERINDVIAARTRQLAVENAMAYVERLKLAAQEGSIEDLNSLIFATSGATNSTWGLVYAELELMRVMGELNDSQYQGALHNIQAMQDLAENAVQNIGRATDSVAKNMEETRKQLEATKDGLQSTLDKLEDMQDGSGDLVDFVMEMLKHRIQQQIDLLEEMKDKFSEIINLKKESLDASKEEQDYQKTIAKKLREMAKLQERINALSLDDSRSAQAERTKLLEEMAELQEDLSDTQADKAIDATKDALDKMEEDYHAEKDKEIKILEDSISSTQKLYNKSIAYIKEHWSTLLSELQEWNYNWGTHLSEDIQSAWDSAQAAAQRYGDFVTAIMGGISSEIDGITAQIKALDEQISSLSSSTSAGAGGIVGGVGNPAPDKNTVIGNVGNNGGYSPADLEEAKKKRAASLLREMQQNSLAWHTASEPQQKALHEANIQKAAQVGSLLGVNVTCKPDGSWYVGSELLYQKYADLIRMYHTGGFVGKDPLKPDEQYIRAKNGELILTSNQQDSLAAQIDRITLAAREFENMDTMPIMPAFTEGLTKAMQSSINSIEHYNNQPVTVNQGDVVIQGAVMSPKQLAENINPYINVTRDMANQLGKMLHTRAIFTSKGGFDNSKWK